MATISKYSGLIVAFLLFLVTSGYSQQPVEMADGLRAEGKIYVVVAIILIVLLGLFAYLFRIDRGLKKLEDKLAGKG